MDIKSVFIMRICITVIFLHVLEYSSGHSIDTSFHDPYFIFRRKREAQCAAKYYKVTPDHSACLPRAEGVMETGVSEADKQGIVDYHNNVRRNVTNPTAKDMRELSWDDELANVAQSWAEHCRIEHDEFYKRRIYGRFSVGQNLSWCNIKITWLAAMAIWANEVQHFTYGGPNDPKKMGHYTQMVWSESAKIGCGYAHCASSHYYACNYGPAGNLNFNKPYKVGTPCEDCSVTCNNNLCDCSGAVCENDGEMDLNTCTCSCYKNLYYFTLPYCGLNCTGLRDQPTSYFCSHFNLPDCQAYSNVPLECPVMCNWCPDEDTSTTPSITSTTTTDTTEMTEYNSTFQGSTLQNATTMENSSTESRDDTSPEITILQIAVTQSTTTTTTNDETTGQSIAIVFKIDRIVFLFSCMWCLSFMLDQ